MKIDPKHDYKKPLYAAGIATLIGATALFGTACGPQIAGGLTIAETEVQLEGEAQIVPGSGDGQSVSGKQALKEGYLF